MGVTWIVGVLIVEVEALVPLAYIYTIMVAFQGLFIFLLYVLLSKQVRDAYTNWWKAIKGQRVRVSQQVLFNFPHLKCTYS